MRILVTDVCGYIGSRLAELLQNCGYSIYGFDKRDLKTVSEALDGFLLGDLCHKTSLEKISWDIDVVIDLAGEASVDADSRKHRENNVIGSMNLFQWAVDKKIKKIILLSTVKIADSGSYAKSKQDSENRLVNLCKQHNCSFTILRSSPVFGLGMKGGVASWVNQYNKRIIPDVRNSSSELAMIGLNDLCRAIRFCLQDNSVVNKTFRISDGTGYMIKSIDCMAKHSLGRGNGYFHIPRSLLWFAAKIGDVLEKLGIRIPITTSRYLMLYSNLPDTDRNFSAETGMVFSENFLEMLPAIFGDKKK